MAEANVNDSMATTSEINPGNQMAVTIVFDVPADAVPDHIILHDSAFLRRRAGLAEIAARARSRRWGTGGYGGWGQDMSRRWMR
ncbi:hypothetical protein [Nocardia wallacei]|uniref:hypothetical protein n=1 Tax=Nocardia wallacei TaxID=480035 RepID=UPI003CC7C80E